MIEKIEMPEVIECDGFRLVKPSLERVPDIFESIDTSRDFLREFLAWVDNTKAPEDTEKALEHFLKKWNDDEGFLYWIEVDGRVCGCIDSVKVSKKNHYLEFGYWLDKRFNKRGIMTKSVAVIEPYLKDRGFKRLVICCDVANKASQAVAEKNGYEFEGIMKSRELRYGKYYDIKLHAKIL